VGAEVEVHILKLAMVGMEMEVVEMQVKEM